MTGIMERKYVRMLKAGEQPDFPDEAQLSGFGARVRIENFQGDAALVSRIACQVDSRKRTLPNLPLDLVAASEGCSKWSERILRGGRSCYSILRSGVRSPPMRIEHANLSDLNAALTQVRAAQHTLTHAREP